MVLLSPKESQAHKHTHTHTHTHSMFETHLSQSAALNSSQGSPSSRKASRSHSSYSRRALVLTSTKHEYRTLALSERDGDVLNVTQARSRNFSVLLFRFSWSTYLSRSTFFSWTPGVQLHWIRGMLAIDCFSAFSSLRPLFRQTKRSA